MKTPKLTIELVPATCWFKNVRAVLSKKQWDALKSKVYTQAWYICQICGGTGPKHPVECHEIWNFDDNNLIQKLEGMIALCPNCHMVKHMGLARIQGNGDLALKHFMKINKMKLKEAEAYINASFWVWATRSRQKWTLDISCLEEYGIDMSQIKK